MKAYFSHDEGARNDPKLVQVMMELGHEGKSVYWDLVEMLYEQGGYLMLAQCKGYAFALRTNCDLILKLVNDFDLFASDSEKFWSETALRRLSQRNSKSAKAKESATKRWSASERNANALPPQSEGNAIKEKESKVKKELNDVAAGSQAGEALNSHPESQSDAGTVGGPARLVTAEDSEVFTRVGFREFVKSIGFGTIDMGHYLMQILHEAKKEAKPRPTSGKGLTWEGFVKNYLNNDRLHNRLVCPMPAAGAPHAQQQRLGAPTPATMPGDLRKIAAAQLDPIM